jgi:YbgC/YbaW family acyl-CoA thioester hydrolase
MPFEFVDRRRVDWVDTDAGGRIHHTAAFRYAEHAETEALRNAGITGPASYPRRRVEAEFHRVLRFDDELEVRLRAERVGRTSITWAWTISRDGEVCVEGRHTVVHVDDEGRPTPLRDEVRAKLEV